MSKSELRSLDQILALADNGNYLPDLLERHEKLIAEMIDFSNAFGTKATGKVTLKLSYTIDRFGQIELTVEDEIKTPKPPKAKATAWTTEKAILYLTHQTNGIGDERGLRRSPEQRTKGHSAEGARPRSRIALDTQGM